MSIYTTICEVKSIVLPQICPKHLDICIGEDSLNDTDELNQFDNDKIFVIVLKQIYLPIKLPDVLHSKIFKILIDKDYDIKKIKEQLIDDLSRIKKQEYPIKKDKELSLYLLGRKLNDETKYSDLIFVKDDVIESRFVFNFICSKDSTIKFDNFKNNLRKDITIYQCQKKCSDHINKVSDKKCRNIDRIDLKFDGKSIISSEDDALLI